MWRKFRRSLSLIILGISGAMLVWGILPQQRHMEELQIDPVSMSLFSSGEKMKPAILETKQVRMEWPSSTHAGEIDTIALAFTTMGDTARSNASEHLSDAYRDHHLMVEARFEVAGMRVESANPIRKSMLPGQPLKFTWEVSTDQAGVYEGTVWLSLRFLPLDGSPPTQLPIYVHDVLIHSHSLMGISEPAARLIGAAGVILGVAFLTNEWIITIKHRKKKTINSDTKEFFD